MAFRLKSNDIEMLKSIAGYRILSVSQIVSLFQRNRQAIRRRLREFEKLGLLRVEQRELGRQRGRPENLLSLTEESVDILKDKGMLAHNIAYEKIAVDEFFNIDHQLMLNWFRIHLQYAESILPQLEVNFLSFNSPLLPQEVPERCFISDTIAFEGATDQKFKFTPDGVFSIRDSGQDKTILFFLEVDCGTEALASPDRNVKDIRQKIINYNLYFDNLGYKKYEKIWDCKLNGFRLLFLANTSQRLVNLCRLVREMPPTDFIWLTEQSRMFEEGVSYNIWARGGNIEAPPESIFGTACCRAPLPQ